MAAAVCLLVIERNPPKEKVSFVGKIAAAAALEEEHLVGCYQSELLPYMKVCGLLSPSTTLKKHPTEHPTEHTFEHTFEHAPTLASCYRTMKQLLLPYPAPPHPTPPYPTRPYPTLPHPILPHPTLPHPTLPHPTPPYHTLPHPTPPYPTPP